MPYYYVQHTGKKGFVTHTDNETSHVSNYPGDVWITSGSSWAGRVGAEEKTKAEAQALVDTAIRGELDDDGNQISITLP